MKLLVGRSRIPDLLAERGWKPHKLVEETGLDKRTISFYSTNRRKRMPLIVGVIIADALGVSPRDLNEWHVNPDFKDTVKRQGTR